MLTYKVTYKNGQVFWTRANRFHTGPDGDLVLVQGSSQDVIYLAKVWKSIEVSPRLILRKGGYIYDYDLADVKEIDTKNSRVVFEDSIEQFDTLEII